MSRLRTLTKTAFLEWSLTAPKMLVNVENGKSPPYPALSALTCPLAQAMAVENRQAQSDCRHPD